jgi:hypothetical protein
MKKVFLLALALCATVTGATDMAMNCTQQGFQVGLGFGYGLTMPTNTVYSFDGTLNNTPKAISDDLQKIVNPDIFLSDEDGVITFNNDIGLIDITTVALDYSNQSTWQSTPSILASFSVGYKTFFDCNKYSVTGNAFIMLNSNSMTSNLMAEASNFQVAGTQIETEDGEVGAETSLIGGIGSTLQYAGKLKLTSGTVFGFNVLLAKEFNWGNAGLLLGMKFNSYKLSYLQTKLQDITEGFVTAEGFMDITGDTNDNVNLDIRDYTYSKSKTKTATGFTVGFATNYYISDNLSAGLTVFYDMYTPITFNLQDLAICPYTYEDSQTTDSGKIKFQNNTIGVMMNLTYSFGAN